MAFRPVRFAWLTVLVTAISTPSALAQSTPSTPSRFELGAHVSTLRLADVSNTNLGLGGRLTYDLSPWLALEGELAVFTDDALAVTAGPPNEGFELEYRRRRVEGLFGPKIGWRNQRFGVFAKARPGFASLSDRGISCVGPMCALILVARPVYRTELAVDLGGVFEVYPTSRLMLRLDVGDTIIRHRSSAPPCASCSTHNLATNIGIGMRF